MEPRPGCATTCSRTSGVWGAHLLTAALERREDELHNPATLFAPDLKRDRSQNALALGYGFNHGGHSLQANLRRDDDSEFGGKSTGSLSYGYAITPQWRVTAAGGTSFRAPTLYQRFSEYGAPSLQPEKGRNIELGQKYALDPGQQQRRPGGLSQPCQQPDQLWRRRPLRIDLWLL